MDWDGGPAAPRTAEGGSSSSTHGQGDGTRSLKGHSSTDHGAAKTCTLRRPGRKAALKSALVSNIPVVDPRAQEFDAPGRKRQRVILHFPHDGFEPEVFPGDASQEEGSTQRSTRRGTLTDVEAREAVRSTDGSKGTCNSSFETPTVLPLVTTTRGVATQKEPRILLLRAPSSKVTHRTQVLLENVPWEKNTRRSFL